MMAASNMYADTGWVDVTDTYIMNPRFDNNDVSGWWGTQFNISGNSGEYGEHYERLFDSYQDLTGLTPGHYRLSVQAYFRSGTSDDDYQHSISSNPSEYQKVQLFMVDACQSFSKCGLCCYGSSFGLCLISGPAVDRSINSLSVR